MDRFLLFDAQCGVCARLAAQVARKNTLIATRPLSDLDMQGLVEHARPGAGWKPALIEVEYGESLRVSTGLRLRVRLVRLLGGAEAWRLWRSTARIRRRRRAAAASADERLRDARTRAAIGRVLMSSAFRMARARLGSTRPTDAWWDEDTGRHVVAFPARGRRANERVLAFTVDESGAMGPAEILVEPTTDGWRLTNVSDESETIAHEFPRSTL